MVLEETTDVTNVIEKSFPSPKKPQGIPEGKYRLVGWGVDSTGRRLIDEICQISAFLPTSQFSQYIMPFADLNPSYRKKHNIKVVTLGRYRMLKDIKTNKFVKTKSEISALIDFLSWLENIRGDGMDGVILLYHENRKTSPGLLLEALRRYNLLEKFNEVVKGFANCYNLAEAKCAKTTKTFSLRILSRVLLDKEQDLGSATERAKVCYEIAVHLSQGERQDLETSGSGDCRSTELYLTELIRPYGNTVAAEEAEVAGFKVILERQNTFRPVFGALLKATRTERVHASHLRRLLAENNMDFNRLKEAFEKGGKQELEDVLQKEVANAQEKDMADLLEILDCFFDPTKKPVEPKPRLPREPRRQKLSSSRENEKENAMGENGAANNNNNNVNNKSLSSKLNAKTEVPAALSGSASGTTTTSSSELTTPRTDHSAIEESAH